MSNQESDRKEKNGGQSKKSKFSMQKLNNIRKLEKEDIFSYIEDLHGLLKKNGKKIKKYKEKIKKLVEKVEDLEQIRKGPNKVTPVDQVISVGEVDKEDTPLSLVDEIRQAAEQAQNLNGFVYEPTSGLYYDQKTGYYYNAEYGLYYDGNTGCYYKYNQDKNEFEFHSQVSVTESTAAATRKTSNDNDIFDNYTIGATADSNEEWGVITQRPRLKVKTNKNKNRKSPAKNRKDSNQQRKRKHNQRYSSSETDRSDNDRISTRDKRKADSLVKVEEAKDMEDGELDSSNSTSDSQDNQSSCCNMETDPEDDETVEVFSKGSHFQDIAKKYPPSLRIIVLESQQEDLKVGSLSLITFKGGTLGREGKHDVIIPDVNVSKFHLKFIYDTKRFTYKCIDLGSRNGTLLNGCRMSTSKTESSPLDLVHGSVLQIGQTKLLCHVHEGNSTCGQCEPGLLIETASKDSASTSSTTAVALTHKEQLKKLQKRYGLENEKFIETKQVTNSSYNDRAATRRIQVGSSTDKEKTQVASVNTAISSENKGFKMLSKLGWSKGEALGKTSASGGGLLEPINVSSNAGKKGLGCEDVIPSAPMLTLAAKTKLANLKKTQERYQKADIFHDSDDDDNNSS